MEKSLWRLLTVDGFVGFVVFFLLDSQDCFSRSAGLQVCAWDATGKLPMALEHKDFQATAGAKQCRAAGGQMARLGASVKKLFEDGSVLFLLGCME